MARDPSDRDDFSRADGWVQLPDVFQQLTGTPNDDARARALLLELHAAFFTPSEEAVRVAERVVRELTAYPLTLRPSTSRRSPLQVEFDRVFRIERCEAGLAANVVAVGEVAIAVFHQMQLGLHLEADARRDLLRGLQVCAAMALESPRGAS